SLSPPRRCPRAALPRLIRSLHYAPNELTAEDAEETHSNRPLLLWVSSAPSAVNSSSQHDFFAVVFLAEEHVVPMRRVLACRSAVSAMIAGRSDLQLSCELR